MSGTKVNSNAIKISAGLPGSSNPKYLGVCRDFNFSYLPLNFQLTWVGIMLMLIEAFTRAYGDL